MIQYNYKDYNFQCRSEIPLNFFFFVSDNLPIYWKIQRLKHKKKNYFYVLKSITRSQNPLTCLNGIKIDQKAVAERLFGQKKKI